MTSLVGENVPTLKLIDFSLRLLVVALSVATISLTVTNKQDNATYGNLEYKNLLGLKYMICISALSAGYALFAAASTWVQSMVNKVWFFFVSDQVVTYLMVTSMSAVAEILYLAYNGARKVTWSEACSSYGNFCTKMKIALIFHTLALICFFILSVISAYRIFSTFEPPLPSQEHDEQ